MKLAIVSILGAHEAPTALERPLHLLNNTQKEVNARGCDAKIPYKYIQYLNGYDFFL